MNSIKLMGVHEAFDWVMDHYYPAGLEEFAQLTDSYAIISIQDTHTRGFGVRFCESATCKGALTLLFDDLARPVAGAVMFDGAMAQQIIDFIQQHRDSCDTLVCTCYAGRSRSRAVAAFAAEMLGLPDSFHGEAANQQVLETLRRVWSATSADA